MEQLIDLFLSFELTFDDTMPHKQALCVVKWSRHATSGRPFVWLLLVVLVVIQKRTYN